MQVRQTYEYKYNSSCVLVDTEKRPASYIQLYMCKYIMAAEIMRDNYMAPVPCPAS